MRKIPLKKKEAIILSVGWKIALQTQIDRLPIQVKHTISSEYLSFKIILIIGNLIHLSLHLAK